MAQRQPTRASIEEDIEETQRQIRDSAELIQSAFDSLSSLHSRVTEVVSQRAQGRTPTAPISRTRISVEVTSGSSRGGDRSSMDPGHDAILLSSPNPPATTAESTTPGSSSPGRPRAPDSSLSNLRSEIMMSTESVRSRAGELDELRRTIVLHTQDRQRQEALQRILLDSPHRLAGTSARDLFAADSSANRSSISSLPARSRRQLLESSLRQRSADDSATSLGAMVTARAETRRMSQRISEGVSSTRAILDTPTLSPIASISAPAQTRTPASQMPPGIATRLSRLAQEIQQDISRIAQQSESLMSWINEHRTRLDAGLAAARPTALERDRSPSPSANRTPRPSHASIAVAAATSTQIPETGTSISPRGMTFAPRNVSSSTGQARSDTRTRGEGDESSTAFPRMASRRRLDATQAYGSLRAQTGESVEWVTPPSRGANRDGPLSRSSRMDGSSPSSSTQIPALGTSTPGSSNVLQSDPELAQSMARVRSAIALARARQARRHGGEDDDEPTETRNYRVRRRLNADGDEDQQRVPMRAIRNFSWRRGENHDSWDFDDDHANALRTWAEGSTSYDDDRAEDDIAWYGALQRLDAMSRDQAGNQTEQHQRRWESMFRMDDDGSPVDANGDETAYPVNLGQRPVPSSSSSSRQSSDTTADRASEYERNRSAMIARAHALTSSLGTPGSLSRSSTTLPPPPPAPPAARPFSLVSTTQNTPGSLWNDSGVRVRIRSAVARLDEDMRALDAARDRAQSSQPLMRSSFWPPDYAGADGSPPSPPLDRSMAAEVGDVELEQPMWGSPMPFHPSPLPLPRVENVSSLQARSRAYGGAKVARMSRRRAPVAGR